MSGNGSFGFLFLFAFFASFSSPTQQQDPTYVYHICPNKITYSKNSTYSSNLKNLLISLSSGNPFFSSGFYSTVYGQSPDEVFGLFLCRGDVSPDVCRNCVVFAANDTRNRCPEEKAGLIWYDQCMLRYADQNFFLESSLQNGTNGAILVNTQSITANQLDRFRDLVLSTLNQSATEAALENSRKFDVRKASLNALQTVYVLVQCIPDLTRQDCLRCLQGTINLLLTDRIGGRVILASCSSRYELYAFYNGSDIRAPQPQLDSAPPPPPPPISILSPAPGKGKGGNSSVIIIAVVVPITLLFLLFVAVFSFQAKRKKTTYETEPLAGGKKNPFS